MAGSLKEAGDQSAFSLERWTRTCSIPLIISPVDWVFTGDCEKRCQPGCVGSVYAISQLTRYAVTMAKSLFMTAFNCLTFLAFL